MGPVGSQVVGIVQLVELAQPLGAVLAPCADGVRVCGQVDAAFGHVLLKRDAEGVFSAALGELDSVLQAPGVQLLVSAGGSPVEVVAVAVLESHGVVD